MGQTTIFVNGKVLTVNAAFAQAEAVVIEGERILAVGSTREMRKFRAAGAREVDLQGRTLMPGFVDTHGHVALFGLDELKVSLTGAATKHEILARLQSHVATAQPGEWVVAMPIGDPPYFLNANRLRADGAIPTLAELDAIAPDNPLYIQAPTNRVPNFAVLNSAALRAAEMGCDALFKGTSVDGVYSADPKKDPDAKRYETLSYQEVLAKNLKVMDSSAVALMRDNHIPIVVFNIRERDNLLKVLNGEGVFTTIA
jgi:predicted amidohydrolase YtcJ